MQELIHNKVQMIEGFFTEFNQIQKLYAEKSFEFESQFLGFLTGMAQYFQTVGNTSQESEVLRILSLIQTVKRGFDPSKMEKITYGKREFFWGVSYVGIESLNNLLQEIYAKEMQKLDEADEMISNLLLNLIQQGLLNDQQIAELSTVAHIEVFWKQLLTQNGSISLINKKLLTKLIAEDIYLIIEKTLLRFT